MEGLQLSDVCVWLGVRVSAAAQGTADGLAATGKLCDSCRQGGRGGPWHSCAFSRDLPRTLGGLWPEGLGNPHLDSEAESRTTEWPLNGRMGNAWPDGL